MPTMNKVDLLDCAADHHHFNDDAGVCSVCGHEDDPVPQPTKIFYVASETEAGDNASAFVEATDANDAINQWHAWLKFAFCYEDDDETPDRTVFEIPALTGASKFIAWHAEGGITLHEI